MKRISVGFTLLLVMMFCVETALAQGLLYHQIHKVKRKETIFGIARMYGITVEDILNSNPEMKSPDYPGLRKGDFIVIPKAPEGVTAPTVAEEPSAPQPPRPAEVDMRQREIRVGVMLPLHDINGDGRRMTEYYRGVLMACDSLKQGGISVDIHAWNVPEEADIRETLKKEGASRCDLIIGPLYSKQVKALSDFAEEHDIRVLIPFSINAPELQTNSHLYQVYQHPTDFNEAVIRRFMERFKGVHPVFVDCNDSTSKKGVFTFGLRRQLEAKGIDYSLTNLKSGEAAFQKAFSTTKKNVVILNTGRSPELNVAIAKLNGLTMNNPQLDITLFGYTEWMMYTKYNLENFYKYDVHIPAAFYYNPLSARTDRINLKYRWNFHSDMMNSLPRFAITGFDHAYFFIKGLHMYGKHFTGSSGMVGYTPFQTPLSFERVGNGGWQNRSLLFVNYTKDHRVETINR